MSADDEPLATDELPTVVVRSPVPAPPPTPGPRWFRILAVLLGSTVLLGGVIAAIVAAIALWPRPPTDGLWPVLASDLDPVRRPVPEPHGPFAGLVIYVSAGHGYLLHREHHDGRPIQWGLQRDALYGIIEDVYTAAFVADELAPRLEEAGATVIALRERDRNPTALISDDDASFQVAGASEIRADVLAQGGYAYRLHPGGTATWALTVPEDGEWYVYTRWLEDDDQDAQAVYTVHVDDRVVEEVVDQRVHGGHWWKLFDGCLQAGTVVEVTLRGSGGAPLSADAVRLGGGTLRFVPEPDLVLREHKAFDVSFAHQADWLGSPEDVPQYTCGNPRSDMRMRPHWVDWASPPDEDAIYISIHTNGGRGQGAIVFAGIDSTPPTPPRDGSEALAAAVEAHLLAAGRTVDPTYKSKGWMWGDYSEISPVHNPLPAVLVELAFHDNPKDAKRLRDPRMQGAMAQGIADGVVAWRQTTP